MDDKWSGSWCPQCGPDVPVDEDGCCKNCGCDAVGEGAEQALRLSGRGFPLKVEPLDTSMLTEAEAGEIIRNSSRSYEPPRVLPLKVHTGECGEPITPDRSEVDNLLGLNCGRCADLRRASKAQKLTIEEAESLRFEVLHLDWWPELGDSGVDGGGWFSDLQVFADAVIEELCFDKHLSHYPKIIWPTKRRHFTLDADDIIARALEEQEFYEEIEDQINDADREELQELLDEWIRRRCKSVVTYDVDYTRVIELTNDFWRHYLDKFSDDEDPIIE